MRAVVEVCVRGEEDVGSGPSDIACVGEEGVAPLSLKPKTNLGSHSHTQALLPDNHTQSPERN
jgi:hypothetical protein